jgi:hypothetical protein
MANVVFNVAKGRVAELYNRVDLQDPSTSRLFVIPISAGAVSDATAIDQATFADLVTAGVTERAANGWNRKTLANTDLAAIAADNTNDRMPLDIGDQTWTAVTTDAVTDLVICYSSVTSPTNSQLVPLTMHDFAITPDGSDVVAQVADFYRAS